MMEEVRGEFEDMSAMDTQVAAAEAIMQLSNFAYYSAGQKSSDYPGRFFLDFLQVAREAVNLFSLFSGK